MAEAYPKDNLLSTPDDALINQAVDQAILSTGKTEDELKQKTAQSISTNEMDEAFQSQLFWQDIGVQYPENAEYFQYLHNTVLDNKLELVEQTEEGNAVTTLRIGDLDLGDKVYLINYYDPIDKKVLDPNIPEDFNKLVNRAKGLEKLGIISAYNSWEEADEDVKRFYPHVIKNSTRKDQDTGQEILSFEKGGLVSKAVKPMENTIANMLGIQDEDLQWANSLGKRYGGNEELDGRGDAARHLALGWLASKSKNPKIAIAAINAREYLSFDAGKNMDTDNNNKGIEIKAEDKEQAEKAISELIENKEAVYMSLDDSVKLRGYKEGGLVPNKLDPGIYQDDAGNLFKVSDDGNVSYVNLKE